MLEEDEVVLLELVFDDEEELPLLLLLGQYCGVNDSHECEPLRSVIVRSLPFSLRSWTVVPLPSCMS